METNGKNMRDGETECRDDGPSWQEASRPIAGLGNSMPDNDAAAKSAERDAVVDVKPVKSRSRLPWE